MAIVGHSRGAHFAKVLATWRPELVACVVSLGSGLDTAFDISAPMQAAVLFMREVFSHTSDRIGRRGCFTAACECRFARDYAAGFPPGVPLTSIYSKGDGTVRWRACRRALRALRRGHRQPRELSGVAGRFTRMVPSVAGCAGRCRSARLTRPSATLTGKGPPWPSSSAV